MNFEYPQKTQDLIKKVDDFMEKHLFPHEKKVYEFSKTNLWENYPELDNWKKLAKKEGLWNLFLPSNLDLEHELESNLRHQATRDLSAFLQANRRLLQRSASRKSRLLRTVRRGLILYQT